MKRPTRGLIVLAILTAALLTGGCNDPVNDYPTQAACQEAMPTDPSLHCDEWIIDGVTTWRIGYWYGSEAACTEATGSPCVVGMCETECGPFRGGSGWATDN